MIKDGSYDEIKESILETLGWSVSGLCLAVIKTLREIDCLVFRWTNSDDPHHVVSHVDVYLVRHPDEVYAAMKSVLREYDLEFDDWEWKELKTPDPVNSIFSSPLPGMPGIVVAPAPPEVKWIATLSFRSKHVNWTENDPPAGGYRIPNGWQYEPHSPRGGLDSHGFVKDAVNEARGN
jgi:hypothetical protein